MRYTYFTKNNVKYRILESATMMHEGEIVDAVRYAEMKTGNDLPKTFIAPESVLFSKIDVSELKFVQNYDKHIPSEREKFLLDKEEIRWNKRYK